MILNVNQNTLDKIKNPHLRSYAEIYVDIERDFLEQIKASGIEIDTRDYSGQVRERMEKLEQTDAVLRNDEKSVVVNEISPACVACQTGRGSATFFISLQCHRDCYYCFNPNQQNYDYYQTHPRDVIAELQEIKNQNQHVEHLALTGGEPLLQKEKTIEFFDYARVHFPGVYTRLYTCGDHIDRETLQDLQEAGLTEIRFSIRMHDLAQGQRGTFERIALANEYIPFVMVEMPVLPDTLEEMKDILRELDDLGLYSINLLELCYPLTNEEEFNQRGYQVKERPFRVLYNYWYAGGLPIAGSELVCLDLVKFALEEELSLGVHYCSVENKQTGQIYQQNYGKKLPPTAYFSERDYFIKTAKVFGEDIRPVRELLTNLYQDPALEENREHDYLEFHVEKIPALASLDIEVGISTNVFETRDGETYLRELKVDVTTPQQFRLEML